MAVLRPCPMGNARSSRATSRSRCGHPAQTSAQLPRLSPTPPQLLLHPKPHFPYSCLSWGLLPPLEPCQVPLPWPGQLRHCSASPMSKPFAGQLRGSTQLPALPSLLWLVKVYGQRGLVLPESGRDAGSPVCPAGDVSPLWLGCSKTHPPDAPGVCKTPLQGRD